MTAQPVSSEEPVEAAMRLLGEGIAIFDPLRFRMWAELGLTTAQLRVMFMVREQPGVTAGELATRLSVTPPTISGIVDRLVKLTLVRRDDDRDDRRLVRNHLTEAGEASCGRLARSGELYTRRIVAEMDADDLERLSRGLESLVKAAEHVARVEPNLAAVAMPGASTT